MGGTLPIMLNVRGENLVGTTPATEKQLQSELHDLGIQYGDSLIVHASTRSIGPVEGRGQGVLSALLTVLGPAGTLMA